MSNVAAEETGSAASSSSPYSMTEEILMKRAKKPNCGRISTQLFAGVVVCISSMSFGTALGWSGPVTYHLMKNDETMDTKNFALLVSMLSLGCGIGITSCTLFMKQFGPRKTLRWIAPFYILTWWLMLIPDINLQLAGRFFLGFLGINYWICGENLLLQTVHYAIRRYISIFHQSALLIGVLISKVLGYSTDSFWLTIACGCIPIIHFFLLCSIPESPVFLYETSHKAAAKSLTWYKGEGNFYEDMAHMKKDWDVSRQDPDTYKYMLFSKVVYKGLLIVVGVTFFQVAAGYFIFMFFNINIWTNGVTVTTNTLDATLISVFFVVSKLFWGALYSVVDWKIRRLLITSCFMTSLLLFMLAIHLVLNLHRIVLIYWFPLVAVGFYLFFYDMGLNYFPRILNFEYMPFQVFRRADLIVRSLFWLFNFFIVFGFAVIRLELPSYVIFFGLSFTTFVGGFFCYFFVVEPKGKSLIQVQLELGGNPIGKRGTLFNQTKIIV